ncbi:MAG TPA: hypothetical protein VHM70_17795 [Polyangiaceae bacterium]|nr:hypothetical protein [Polyangiaceae bacterium]
MSPSQIGNSQLLASLLGLCALLASACGSSFDPGSRVDSLRVLAVEADKPYARPGETVHLQALSHDPEQRPLTWAWATCNNPVSASVESCFAAMANEDDSSTDLKLTTLEPDVVAETDVTIGMDVLDALPEETRDRAEVGIVSVACPGQIVLERSATTTMPFECHDPETKRELDLSEFLVGIKHVFVRARDRNANPVLGNVSFDGKTWPADEVKTVHACDTTGNTFSECSSALSHAISVQLSKKSFERGTTEFGRPFEEQLIVQYYATEGIFENEVKVGEEPTTRFVARRGAKGKEILLWIVARDDRGGVSWVERRIDVK